MCSLTWSHHNRSADVRATRIVDQAIARMVTHEIIPRPGLSHELDLGRDQLADLALARWATVNQDGPSTKGLVRQLAGSES